MHDDEGSIAGRPADDAVQRAREQFDDAIALLRLTKERLKRGEIAGVRDVASQVALVIKTLVVLNEARERIDDLSTQRDGAAGALDLQSARAEVWSRLDRLRAAGDAR